MRSVAVAMERFYCPANASRCSCSLAIDGGEPGVEAECDRGIGDAAGKARGVSYKDMDIDARTPESSMWTPRVGTK